MAFVVAAAALLALGLALLNLKSLPFAHSIRLLGPISRILYARLGKRSNAEPKPSRPRTATTYYAETTRVAGLDLDINLHMSNSCFFKDADISRAELLSRLFAPALVDITAQGNSGRAATNILLAGTQGRFLRELKPFQSYTVISGILAWDDAALHVVTYFVRRGAAAMLGNGTAEKGRRRHLPGPLDVLKDEGMRRATYAILVSRYVVRTGRDKVAPEVLLRAAGMLSGDDGEAASVEKERLAGLEYLTSCMF